MSASTCPNCRRNFDPAAAYCPFCGVQTVEAPPAPETAAQAVLTDTAPVPEAPAVSPAPAEAAIPPQPVAEPAFSAAPGGVTLQPDTGAVPPYGTAGSFAPPPRKKRWPVITAIVAAAMLVLCAGAFVSYRLFTRDILLLFMGEEKYAARLEEQLTEKLTDSAAEQMAQLSALLMPQERALTTSSQVKLTLDADFAEKMELDMAEIQPLLDYIGTLQFHIRMNEKDNAVSGKISLSDAQGALLGTEFWAKDGQYLLREPLISEQHLVIGKPADAALVPVTFEKEKLQASLDKLLDIYRQALAEGSVTVTKDTAVSIEDLKVSGVHDLAVFLSSSACKTLLKDLLAALRDDTYVAETLVAMWSNYTQKISNFQNTGIPELTVETYKEAFDDAIRALEKEDFPSLTIHSFLRANNRLAARQYVLKHAKKDVENLTIIFPESQTATSAIEMRFKDGVVHLTNTPSEEKSGELLLYLKDTSDEEEEIFECKLTYADVGTASLLGNTVTTGNFSLAITRLPDSVLEELEENAAELPITKEHFTKSKLQWSSSAEEKTIRTSMTLTLHKIGTVAVNETIMEETAQEVTLPAYSKDKDIVLGTVTSPDESSSAALMEYALKALDYAKKALTEHTDLAKLLEPMEITPAAVDTAKGQWEFQTGVGFPKKSTFIAPEAAGRAFMEARIASDARTQIGLLLPELQMQTLMELQQNYASYEQFTEEGQTWWDENYGADADVRFKVETMQAYTQADMEEFIQTCELECADRITDIRYIEMTLVINGQANETFYINVLQLDGVWYIW